MLSNFLILFEAPVFIVALLIDGLLIGALFALAAYGLALVWGVMNVKNLAQGDFVMMGGYTSWFLFHHGVNPLFGVPLAFVLLWCFGWGVYKLIVSRVIGRDLFTSLLATFGLAIVLQQVMNLMFGSETQAVDAGYGAFGMFDGVVQVPYVKLIGFCMAGLLALGVVLFMKHSRMGQAIRATAQDARAARVLGIDTEKVYAFTFSLNAAICGAAGALIAMIWVIQPFFGIIYSIRSFVIVTAAGLGNLPAVIAAGLGMGVIEQFGGFIMGAEFQQAIVVLLLVAVLIVRQIQQRRIRQVVQ
ncbi:MAG: branched-chain amino acid ABC transporter permease [Pseudomonadota bacterium]|nr:branched-chain amino acid ABC transporter permease [Pseudomonadota bacterium]